MGDERIISSGTTYEELAKDYQSKFKYPIVVALERGMYHELHEPITNCGEIMFCDWSNHEGNRIYLNGLIYLMIYSIRELYGKDTKVYTKYTIDKGLYVETNKKITKDMLKELKNKMLEVVKADYKIVPKNVLRLEAIEYFEKLDEKDKSSMLKYNTNNYITLYKLGDMYDFYFSKMPVSTGILDNFNLEYLNEDGFIMMYPNRFKPDTIAKYQHHAQRFQIYEEYHEWVKIMNIENAAALNDVVSQGNIGNLIRIDEMIQSNKLLNIAREIYDHKERLKIVLIAGPSSSGKTTTSIKLSNYLRSFGLNPKPIAMDNYYKPIEKRPRKEDGSYDYESIGALDIDLFNEHIDKLLNGEEVVLPVFNFATGKKEFVNRIKIAKNDIIIIEGIHALNPEILKNIPRSRKFKFYISPMTGINIDNHNRISTSDNRLLRRIIRDNRTRGNNVEDTLRLWDSVRDGEEKYIFPYQDEANVTFNTALIYEFGILKTYAEPLLYSVDSKSEYYEEAKRLITLLKVFLPMPSESIPDDSLLREFIGGSCFKVN